MSTRKTETIHLSELVLRLEELHHRNVLLDPSHRRVLEHIRTRPDTFPGIGAIYREHGADPSQARRRFRRHFPQPMSRYVRWTRIVRAVQWLIERPELPLDTVAHLVGYRSQGSLTRVFGDETGLTPRFVRRVMRREGSRWWDSEITLRFAYDVDGAAGRYVQRTTLTEYWSRRERATGPHDREGVSAGSITSIPKFSGDPPQW